MKTHFAESPSGAGPITQSCGEGAVQGCPKFGLKKRHGTIAGDHVEGKQIDKLFYQLLIAICTLIQVPPLLHP